MAGYDIKNNRGEVQLAVNILSSLPNAPGEARVILKQWGVEIMLTREDVLALVEILQRAVQPPSR